MDGENRSGEEDSPCNGDSVAAGRGGRTAAEVPYVRKARNKDALRVRHDSASRDDVDDDMA
ncbi:hypothetical protein [Microtetraspora malaysiensis]|uniref:hypothetical protein n=1 Tax=Microtetraspora malaysiensis TaxID=161358 RepID=UPI003D8B46ED